MIAFLLGLQGGYTKHSCFLCSSNSRANEQHYLDKNWPARKDLIPGSHDVLNSSLIERSKILLPPLHIKLGLAKQLVKALKPTSRAFRHIRQMFLSISEAKVKGGMIVGPQIRRMLASEELEEQMSDLERNARQAFRMIVKGFLGNHRRSDCAMVVSNLIESYEKLGCCMGTSAKFSPRQQQVQNFPQLVIKFILKNIRTVEIPWLRVQISAGRALKERQCTLKEQAWYVNVRGSVQWKGV